MATYQTLLEKAQAIYGEAEALLLKDNCTAEDLQTADRMTADADAIKSRASKLHQLTLAKGEALLTDHFTGGEQKAESANEFKSWREFFKAALIAYQSNGQKMDPRLKRYEEKDLSGQTGAAGGILIPSQRMTDIMAIAAPLAIVRPRATKIEMSTRVVSYPMVNQTSSTAGQANFFGGVQVAWQEEGATITTSDAAFKEGELHVRELVGSTRVTNSLLKDVSALATFLGGPRGFPGAIAWAEDFAFLRGDGVNKPLGVLNAPVTKFFNRITAGSVDFEDLTKMSANFMGESPMWVASISLKEKLMNMKGPSGFPSYLWANATNGAPATLLGHPIMWTDKLPVAGAKGDLLLVDWSYYLIGTLEEGTTLESSTQELFSQNKTSFRIVHRVDGKPWLSAPVTLYDGTTSLSPFVGLDV